MYRHPPLYGLGCGLLCLTVLILFNKKLPTVNPDEARCRLTAKNRFKSGTTVVEGRGCRVNATSLDAGVCVQFRSGSVHCVPSLAVIGAMKSGTTNVMLYLSLHPMLRTSENFFGWPIESRFFSSATNASASDSWREYIARYPSPSRDRQLTFDKSPNYLIKPIVPLVLRRLAPSLKLVVMLRNPTRRAYSHFQHDCRNKRIVHLAESDRVIRAQPGPDRRRLPFPCQASDFDAMVRDDIRQAESKYGTSSNWTCEWSYANGQGDSGVVARGLYACQLKRWLNVFPRSHLLPLIFERFVSTRSATLAAVAAVERFVGLPSFDYDASTRVHFVERFYANLPSRLSAYKPMSASTTSFLDTFYCKPNQQLLPLLSSPFTADTEHSALFISDLPWPCGSSLHSRGPLDFDRRNYSALSVQRRRLRRKQSRESKDNR